MRSLYFHRERSQKRFGKASVERASGSDLLATKATFALLEDVCTRVRCTRLLCEPLGPCLAIREEFAGEEGGIGREKELLMRAPEGLVQLIKNCRSSWGREEALACMRKGLEHVF